MMIFPPDIWEVLPLDDIINKQLTDVQQCLLTSKLRAVAFLGSQVCYLS
jgi:hypothetical protein